MVGVPGFEFTETVVVAEVAEQPGPFDIVTEYPLALETTMDCVVAELDHRQLFAKLEVRVTLFPEQIDVLPLGVITGVGGEAFTVTAVPVDVAEQLNPLVTVTVKVPAEETTMDCEVAEFDHR